MAQLLMRQNYAKHAAQLMSTTLLAMCLTPITHAQTLDIAKVPLTSQTISPVKPNVMFIMDDSGSMARAYMPDDVGDFAANAYGRLAAQCNGLAYNPNVDYRVPVDALGLSLADGAYAFPTATSTVTYYTYSGTQPRLGYQYTGGGVRTDTTFYRECSSVIGSAPGSNVFTPVVLDSATMTQNYRNWFTYYRTRMLMAQSATRLAFRDIRDSYRVGYTTINTRAVSGTRFVDVNDFATAHKTDFYTKLAETTPNSGTPLRGALSNAGKYFAKKGRLANGNEQTHDPVQYSCQKNFTILTTDGYWNTFNEIDSEGTNSYGPDKLDNTAVGQQDALAPRPMYDGGTATRTISTPTQQIEHYFRTRTRTQVTTTNQTEYRLSPAGTCSGGRSRLQTRTVSTAVTATQTERSFYARTRTYNSVVTETNGVASAPAIQNSVYGSYTPEGAVSVGSLVPGVPIVTPTTWTNAGSCVLPAPSLPSPNPSAPTTTTGSLSAWSTYSGYQANGAPEAATVTGPAVTSPYTFAGGSTNTLADIAMYYYTTDLRSDALGNCDGAGGRNVCENNVSPGGGSDDTATHQHMKTLTIGMGVNGIRRYSTNYKTSTAAESDFPALKAGTIDWPVPGDNLGAENVDDLWHAAVNGRGAYFSAGDPASLVAGLTDALYAVNRENGSGSGAAASTLQPIAGDDSLFIATYMTVDWVGDLVSRTINPVTGAISPTPTWSAATALNARNPSDRRIYYMARSSTSANTGNLREFTAANLATDGLDAQFSGACSKGVPLTQCSYSPDRVADINSASNMVAFLRGDRSKEIDADRNPTANHLFRRRAGILGDIVGGAPVFVRAPSFQYTENNYASFVAARSGRLGVVYAAANDGMLHAFVGKTEGAVVGGQELWAYVPSMVMDRMYRLADADYANRHEFFANGAPVVGDIYVGGTWKTILVAGLGAGGRGYYALDITDPLDPKPLWEFSNDSVGGDGNLGLTFGNPVITKRVDGTWIVAFTSGYNNGTPGDGNGRLFVVNANTGERLMTLATETAPGVPAGTSSTPSGLGKLNAWVDSTIDNTARRFYAGDLRGNLWRFDIDGLVAPNNQALLLANFNDGTQPQPITTQPALAVVRQGGAEHAVVYVGTGQMLTTTDLSSTNQQALYAIKDTLTNRSVGNIATANIAMRTLTEDTTTRARTVSSGTVDWSTQDGWKVSFLGAGERVNVDVQVVFNNVIVGTNTLSSQSCSVGGSSYLYNFDISSGSTPVNAPGGIVGKWLGGVLVVGFNYLTLQKEGGAAGSGETIVVISDNRGDATIAAVPPSGAAATTGRRTSWRELAR